MTERPHVDHLTPRERVAVNMLYAGLPVVDAMRATGLSFGDVHAAWVRRRERGRSRLFSLMPGSHSLHSPLG